jgi:protein-tyrosine phosphatase
MAYLEIHDGNETQLLSTDSCSKIEENLYLGDYESAKDELLLRRLNIGYVLSVITADIELPIYKGITYFRIPADDIEEQDLLTHFSTTNDYIRNCQHRGGNVLVHCLAGISRSATVVIAYIMKKYRMSYTNAENYVSCKRSIIAPNEGFVRQLKVYGSNFRNFEYK